MSKYPNAGDGLHKLYVSSIGILVCTLFTIVPLIGFLGIIGMLIFEVMYLVGCYQIGKDITACKIAFILQIANIIIGLLEVFSLRVGIVISIFCEFVPLIVMALICFPVSNVMRELGAEKVAKQGVIAWIVYVACTIVSIFIGGAFILLAMQVIGVGAFVLIFATIATCVLVIVGYILLLKFFKNAAEQLGAY